MGNPDLEEAIAHHAAAASSWATRAESPVRPEGKAALATVAQAHAAAAQALALLRDAARIEYRPRSAG